MQEQERKRETHFEFNTTPPSTSRTKMRGSEFEKRRDQISSAWQWQVATNLVTVVTYRFSNFNFVRIISWFLIIILLSVTFIYNPQSSFPIPKRSRMSTTSPQVSPRRTRRSPRRSSRRAVQAPAAASTGKPPF